MSLGEDGKAKIVFAGSGTAGHVYPGIVVAEELVDSFGIAKDAIAFVGAGSGYGKGAIESHGFRFVELRSAAPLRGRTIGVAARSVLKTLAGTREAFELLLSLRPEIVVGIGGYASAPVLVAARALGIGVTVLQEDATFGLANALGTLFSTIVPFAFPASLETFRSNPASRAALRGGTLPVPVRPMVRPAIEEVGKQFSAGSARKLIASAKERLGLDPDRKLACFIGGSLGARPLNEAFIRLVEHSVQSGGRSARRAGSFGCDAILVSGERFFDESATLLEQTVGRARIRRAKKTSEMVAEVCGGDKAVSAKVGQQTFAIVSFVKSIEHLYQASDLMVCRAGAATVGEIVVAGVPAVLLPSSYVAGLHQHANAEALARAGGAVIVEDSQTTMLPSVIRRLLDAPEKLERMRSSSHACSRAPYRAAEVVAELAGLTSSRRFGEGTRIGGAARLLSVGGFGRKS
jgi:UDP-N-acetylglucosamine--N-acetylmuramyl-(pentapeptide) pyrophosphoryl-undecaprenol N-acetylglucosamine transferase